MSKLFSNMLIFASHLFGWMFPSALAASAACVASCRGQSQSAVLRVGAKALFALFALSLALLSGCSGDPYDKYTGYWKRDKLHSDGKPVVMEIRNERGAYVAMTDIAGTEENENFFRLVTTGRGTRLLKLTKDKQSGLLTFEAPLAGAIPFFLSEDEDMLKFNKNEYTRISDSEAEQIKDERVAFYAEKAEAYEKAAGYWQRATAHEDGMPVVAQIRKEEARGYVFITDIVGNEAFLGSYAGRDSSEIPQHHDSRSKQAIFKARLGISPIYIELSEDGDTMMRTSENYEAQYARISESDAEALREEIIASYAKRLKLEESQREQQRQIKNACQQRYKGCRTESKELANEYDHLSENYDRCEAAANSCVESSGEWQEPELINEKQWKRIKGVKNVCWRRYQDQCKNRGFPEEACVEQREQCVINDGNWEDHPLTDRYLMCQEVRDQTCEPAPEWARRISGYDYQSACKAPLADCYETGKWAETEYFKLIRLCTIPFDTCVNAIDDGLNYSEREEQVDMCRSKHADCMDLGEWRGPEAIPAEPEPDPAPASEAALESEAEDSAATAAAPAAEKEAAPAPEPASAPEPAPAPAPKPEAASESKAEDSTAAAAPAAKKEAAPEPAPAPDKEKKAEPAPAPELKPEAAPKSKAEDSAAQKVGSVGKKKTQEKKPAAAPQPKPKPTPQTGEGVWYAKEQPGESASILEIVNSDGTDYFVKLKNLSNNSDVVGVFVRKGESVEIEISQGRYQVFYAIGGDWYGYEHHFGDKGSYGKVEIPLPIQGDSIYRMTLPQAVLDSNQKRLTVPANQF